MHLWESFLRFVIKRNASSGLLPITHSEFRVHQPAQLQFMTRGSDSINCCRNTSERIEVLALPLDESKGFTEDPSYPKSAGLLFGLMWLRAYIAAKKQLPAEHVV